MSPYQFSDNNPILFVDPSGLNATKYEDLEGNTLLETDDGSDDVVVVTGDKRKGFDAAVKGTKEEHRKNRDWNLRMKSYLGEYEKGASSFDLIEINWAGAGEGVTGSIGKWKIESKNSQHAFGKQADLESETSGSLGYGISLSVEVMSATRGRIVFNQDMRGTSIEDLFSSVTHIRTRSMGMLLKYTRVEAYTGPDMSQLVFSANLFGGGVAVLGAGGTAQSVNFKR